MAGVSVQRQSGESYRDAVARENAKYGGLDIIRLFSPGLPASWSNINADVGTTPLVISFKADPKAVAAGDYDTFFRNWFATAPTNRPIWWSFYHEPEDNIEAGAFTAADYRAAWARLAGLSDEARNSQLRATLILMCWSAQKNSGRQWTDYYVPGAVKVLSWDCYNVGAKNGVYRSPTNILENVQAIATSTGLPWGISETGSTLVTGDDGSGRAAWLHSMASTALGAHAQFVTYFGSNVGVEYRLLDAPSAGAWRQVVSGS
jgi:hypothetical protein